MKFLFINKYLVDYYRYLIFIFIISILLQTSSAAKKYKKVPSLYNENDKVSVLTAKNFSSTVYQSKTAWLVEFYASWCGHCRAYANTYREIGIDTLGWRSVVRVAAINCDTDENYVMCEKQNIEAFPTLRLIPPGTTFKTAKIINITSVEPQDVEREVIKKLQELNVMDERWPHFEPVKRSMIEHVFARIPSSVKVILIIIEKPYDFTAREIMLDFSKYSDQLAIFRATTLGKLWLKFGINETDVPALFILQRDKTIKRIYAERNTSVNASSRDGFNRAIRSYIRQKYAIDNYDESDLEEMISSRKALTLSRTMKSTNEISQQNDAANTNVHHQVNMVDLETALSYMLRREISRTKMIQGTLYNALVQWLNVLVKYFPGREPVKAYLKRISLEVNKRSNGLTGLQLRELANSNTPDSYLPEKNDEYEYCAGSAPQYRGYSCALWLLFHTLTVSQAKSQSEQINNLEVLSAVKNFIKYFFGCRHCSDNFMKETSNLDQVDLNDQYAAVIYLWKTHNHVNKRLHGDAATEDPEYPKVPFPPISICPKCQPDDNDFDSSKTIDFLLQFYSKDHIDVASVEVIQASDRKQEIKSDQDFDTNKEKIRSNNEPDYQQEERKPVQAFDDNRNENKPDHVLDHREQQIKPNHVIGHKQEQHKPAHAFKYNREEIKPDHISDHREQQIKPNQVFRQKEKEFEPVEVYDNSQEENKPKHIFHRKEQRNKPVHVFDRKEEELNAVHQFDNNKEEDIEPDPVFDNKHENRKPVHTDDNSDEEIKRNHIFNRRKEKIKTAHVFDDNKEEIKPRYDPKSFKEKYSLIEMDTEPRKKTNIIHFITSVIQRFPFYSAMAFIVILIFARRQYCRRKKLRYII